MLHTRVIVHDGELRDLLENGESGLRCLLGKIIIEGRKQNVLRKNKKG